MRYSIFILLFVLGLFLSVKAQTYPTSKGLNTNYEYISNVTLEYINNSTDGSDADGDGDNGYDDFTNLKTNLNPGTTYTLSVTIKPDSKDYIRAWVDWNGDGDFTDAGEEYTVVDNTSSNGPFTVSITVPTTSANTNKKTRMRVSLKWSGAPASSGDFDYGEVEDYTITTYTDTDLDGIPDITDIDDDGDGITDAAEAGVECNTTEVYYGGNNGHLYKIDFNTGNSSLMTTSTKTSGYINALASNPDDGVVYYGVGTTMYVYNPADGTHTTLKNFSSEISGGNLESGGAAYFNGYLYIAPEDGNGYGTNVYKIPVSNSGMTLGTAVSIGNLAGSNKGWGDFVILNEGASGVIYGQTAELTSAGNGEFWKYDIATGIRTVIRNTSGGTYQLALDLYGRLWVGVGTSMQKVDSHGDTYGNVLTASEAISDMTGPFNCVQGDFAKDTDGDGVANIVDLDADGDGIPDNVEAQSTIGYTSPSGNDADGDGLDDAYDPDNGGSFIGYIDTDNDGKYDYLDLNSDNQGGDDTQEAGLTLSGSDSDGDGLDNNTDATTGYSDPNGTINDPSALPDSDGDVSSGGDVDYRDNFNGNASDHDGDGIPDEKDIDDDNDGITNAEESGVMCGKTEVYVGGMGGKIYKVNFEDATVSLMTTSTISGIDAVNALASNPDDGVVYYGKGTTIYVYNPADGTHSTLKDFSSEISGGNLESGGAAYFKGYLYIAPEDGNGYGTYIYKIPVSNNGMTLGAATSIGHPVNSQGYGDFVISSEKATGVIYGSTGVSGSSDYWKFDIASGTKTVLSSPATNPYQIAIDIYGRKWGAVGKTLRKIDGDGNFYGATITLTENAIDMTGPFNCVQGDFTKDTDGDGTPDYLDLDSDNDGIADVIEAGGTDPDNDGVIGSGPITDTDGDGLSNIVDSDNGGTALPTPDTDGDGYDNYKDIDADNDGIVDNIEGQTTEGYTAPANTDANTNGWDDQYDGNEGGTAIVLTDTDGDGIPDYLDSNSDNDGADDAVEAYDTNKNGVANTVATGNDSDNDGLDDAFDKDGTSTTNNGGSTNEGETPLSFPNDDNSTTAERDWREAISTLPVSLLSFNAQLKEGVVELVWVTASEENNDYFEVQHSDNNIDFTSFDKVKGAGNSNVMHQYYSYDYEVKKGVTYYRLKQVDFDGTIEYSSTVAIRNNPNELIRIFPNPSRGNITVETKEAVEISAYTVTGQEIAHYNFEANTINTINLTNQPKGIYFLAYITNDKRVIKKLIVR